LDVKDEVSPFAMGIEAFVGVAEGIESGIVEVACSMVPVV
jgi:hypothetical protein